MDVAVSDLRAHLSEWLARAESGEEIVVTDRGTPVARLIGLQSRTTIEQLTADGVIARPERLSRPRLSGRTRPRPRRSIADLVSEQRR